MEITANTPLKNRVLNLFFKEKSHFSNRREVNWKSVKKCLLVSIGLGVLILLFMPSPKPDDGPFHEKVEPGSTAPTVQTETDPTQTTLNQMRGGGSGRKVSDSLDYLYAGSGSGGGSGSSGGNDDRNTSMILARGGLDAKTQIPPGSRLSVRLYEKAIVANQGMPVIGVVTKDFIQEDDLAIPQGSKLFGDITYDDGGDRAKVDWRSIQFPDGRERAFSAIGVGRDGQVGVEGKVHSDSMKNTAGQTLSRFIGAYAEGSMQQGAFGSNQGGNQNGWKNAIAETAKDRADKLADGMKKEKRWIEVSNGTEFYAVLTQNFPFRDPGTTNGR